MVKEKLIWHANMTNNLNLMQFSIIWIIKISVYVDVRKILASDTVHSIINREWLNRFKIRDYRQAHRLIFEYLKVFYNTKRIHRSLQLYVAG